MRRNHTKHPRKARSIQDRFDVDYVNLPEHPEIEKIIVIPMKTVYRNLDAAPWATETAVVRNQNHRLLRMIEYRM